MNVQMLQADLQAAQLRISKLEKAVEDLRVKLRNLENAQRLAAKKGN